jgi:hypothetical protein
MSVSPDLNLFSHSTTIFAMPFVRKQVIRRKGKVYRYRVRVKRAGKRGKVREKTIKRLGRVREK